MKQIRQEYDVERAHHSKKMPIPFTTKTVNAEWECDANCQRYPCAPHGRNQKNPLQNTNESVSQAFFVMKQIQLEYDLERDHHSKKQANTLHYKDCQ
jgi:hypothetical protein